MAPVARIPRNDKHIPANFAVEAGIPTSKKPNIAKQISYLKSCYDCQKRRPSKQGFVHVVVFILLTVMQ